MNWTIIGPILAAAVTGGLVQIVVSWSNRKKTAAESTNLIAEAADHIVGRLENEISELRQVLKEQNITIKSLHNQIENQDLTIRSMKIEITELRNEVRRLGGDPDNVGHLL